MRDMSYLLEKNLQQWHSNKISSRKDGTKCYFCGWQLNGELLTRAQRMIQLAKQHKDATPKYWWRFSEKGRRQRRTFDASEEALDACKEYLAAESKMLRFAIMRSEFHCSALESGNYKTAESISESDKTALEEEYFSVETCLESEHKPGFSDGELYDWTKLKTEIWRDLYYLRPLGGGWSGFEEEEVEMGAESNFLGHIPESFETEDIEMEDV